MSSGTQSWRLLSTSVCLVAQLCLTLSAMWTGAHQILFSMGFSNQEYWSRSPFPPPEDLSDPGIDPVSSVSPVLAGGFFTTESSGKPY